MTSYTLAVKVDDQRDSAERFARLVKKQARLLKSVVADYFDGQNELEEGDEIEVNLALRETDVRGFAGIQLLRTELDVEVSGVFAGEPFEFRTGIKEPIGVDSRKKKSEEEEQKLRHMPPSAEDDQYHTRLFAELSETLFDDFEQAIGRSSSPVAIRWKFTKRVLMGLELLFLVFIFWKYYIGESIYQSSAGARWFFWLICVGVGALLYMIGYVVCAATMPLEFFEDHREGHRVMGFVNSDDPREARHMLRISVVALVVIGVLAAFIYGLVSS